MKFAPTLLSGTLIATLGLTGCVDQQTIHELQTRVDQLSAKVDASDAKLSEDEKTISNLESVSVKYGRVVQFQQATLSGKGVCIDDDANQYAHIQGHECNSSDAQKFRINAEH